MNQWIQTMKKDNNKKYRVSKSLMKTVRKVRMMKNRIKMKWRKRNR